MYGGFDFSIGAAVFIVACALLILSSIVFQIVVTVVAARNLKTIAAIGLRKPVVAFAAMYILNASMLIPILIRLAHH